MIVGYLVNQYPKVSHSFVRREIHMLEAQGIIVKRWAMRGWDGDMVDPLDIAERARTRYLLGGGVLPLLAAAFALLVSRPAALLRGFALTWRMLPRSDRSLPLHLISFLEAALLAREMERAGVRHLHAHFGMNSAEVAMVAAAIAGIPYSFTVHGPDEFDKPEFSKLGLKVRHARFVAAISPFCASQIFRWADPQDWDKIRIIRCGLDPAYFAETPTAPATTPRFVCVARLSAQKGHLLLIDAVARLHARGRRLELILVGDGELRPQVEAAIDRHGLRDSVRITGWADEAAVRAALISAQALLLPSFAEGLPVVIMEAMALGRPVLASNVGAVAELVVDGRTGWLFAPGSVEQICDAVEACLSTAADDRAAMAQQGHARVRDRHDASVEARKLATLFSETGSTSVAPALYQVATA